MAQGALRRRRAAAGLLAAGALAAEVAAPAGTALLAVLDVAVAVAFAAGAAAAAAASPRAADLALAVAAAWVLGTLAGLDDLPSQLADVAVLLHRAPLTLLLLTYPGRRLHGAAARGLAVAALLAPFAGSSGPTVSAAVAGLVTLATATRAARAPAALRAPQTAAAAAAAAIAATAGLAAAGLGHATALLVAYDLVLLATAAGLLGSLAGGRWSAAATTGLVVELGTAPAGAPITARLAEVLGDPSLELRLRLVGGSWTDEAGRPAPAPAVGDGRRGLTRRLLDDGTELALLHDPAAIPDPAAAASAVAVAATVVDNARRDREVQARIEQLRRLRRGLLDAADEERRQLELELRSGPLHEVELLDQLLRNLPYEHVEALRRELALAHGELVDTAHGLYPTALEKHGLAKSLSAAAARSPVPVTVDANLDETTLPRPVALTAYYVATEALTNIAKHARAEHARLELSACAGELLLRIVDDGVGGADPAGSGLSGLRDRAQALDGELRVRSPPDDGTVIEARLPLSGT